MAQAVLSLAQGVGREELWFLEHPAVYTYGPRTDPLQIQRAQKTGIPVVATARGGQLTFHGLGQRVLYGMLHLRMRSLSMQAYVFLLEQWILDTLAVLAVRGFRSPPHTGVWTEIGKIAALGIHVSSGITSHGVALNIDCDLQPFREISPCGLSGMNVTSLQVMGIRTSKEEVDAILCKTCPW